MTMSKRLQFSLLGLLFSSLTLCVTPPGVYSVDAPDEQDFMFLAESEAQPAELPDTKDEEVIQPGKKKLVKKPLAPEIQFIEDEGCTFEAPIEDAFASEELVEAAEEGDCTPNIVETPRALQRDLPNVRVTPFIEHDKVEDIQAPVLPPIFLIKKKCGEFSITGRYRPEVFYQKNNSFLNECFENDRLLIFRQTFDITFNALAGNECTPKALEFKTTVRNKGNWGSRKIVTTTETTLNLGGANFGSHTHDLGRHVVWIREGWLKTNLNGAFGWDEKYPQHLIVGFYPFKIGQGIALGDAYALNGQLVGFFSDNAVDQYAPGVLFTGELKKERISYDLYFALLRNHAADFGTISEPIYANRTDILNHPTRGFGHLNWLLAFRTQLVPLRDDCWGTLQLEPYILYNDDPEQRIEFPADAESKFGTGGFAIDYNRGGFEFSFEFAKNFGHQKVFGWDRNVLQITTDANADLQVVNTNVTVGQGGPLAPATKANQAVITTSPEGMQYNNQEIDDSGLYNTNRYDDPYCTAFDGWMLVTNMAYWWKEKQYGLAVEAGVASGDEAPNILNSTDPKAPLPDGKYQGFIGMQEIFSGDLVESAYFLGQRRLVRPVSLVDDTLENSIVPAKVSEFTNLIYTGIAGHVRPKVKCKPYIRPNILWYWQYTPTRAFDCATKQILPCNANNFYGTELNLFVDVFPYDWLKFFAIAALFVPGAHYKDLQGLPVTKEAIKNLVRNPNENVNPAPTLGKSIAYFINIGLEFKF